MLHCVNRFMLRCTITPLVNNVALQKDLLTHSDKSVLQIIHNVLSITQ